MDEKTSFQNRNNKNITRPLKKLHWVLPVVIILLMGIAIYFISSGTQKKMEASATANVRETVQMIADNVKGSRENAIHRVYDLASTMKMNHEAQDVLRQAKENDAFSWAAVAKSSTGRGVTYTGENFNNKNLHCEETATKGKKSVSRTFLSDQGVWAYMVQCPIYENGVLTGALYADISMEQYDDVLPSDLYNGEGSLFVLDKNTKRFVYRPSQTNLHISSKYDLQGFLSGFGVTDTAQEQKIINAIQKDQWQILRLPMDGEPSYMYFWPVADSDWYLCGIVPEASIQRESIAVGRTIQLVIVVIVLCSAMLLLFFYWSMRQRNKIEEKQRLYRMELFNGIAESINDVVLMYDCGSGENEIAFENIKRVLGVSYKELLDLSASRDFREKYGGTALEGVLCQRQFAEKENCTEKLEWYNPDTKQNQWINIEIIYTNLTGIPKCIVSIFDFTQEKLMQDSLRTTAFAAENANRVKSEFLSNMSHEIRTPMNAALGMIQLAQQYLEQKKDIREYLGKAELASRQLLSLINDMLDISRIESGKMLLSEEWFRLDELIARLISTIGFQANQKGQQFLADTEECKEIELFGDSVRLGQILTNLLSNAVKYTQSGGRVNLSIHNEPGRIRGYRQFTFTITDNGVGMSKDFQEKMFLPFERESSAGSKKENGTGLGLSIVQNLVSLMGGYIKVNSELEEGTSFSISIDFLVKTAPVLEQAAENWDEMDLNGLRVLVAEDNELNREIATEFLKQVHAEVECAEDGKQAYNKFADSPEGYYDLILMDMQMPVWDGITATSSIRALDRADAESVPILAATANAFREDEKKCLDAGMNGYITKPMDSQKLYRKILELMEIEDEK